MKRESVAHFDLVKMQNGTFDIYLDGDLFKVTITFGDGETKQVAV